MASNLFYLLFGVLFFLLGCGFTVPYWLYRIKMAQDLLNRQWIMYCDDVVNAKIAQFFENEALEEAAIAPMNVVKPLKSNGEVN